MTRLVVVGWDGATWDLLTPWAQEGKLPNVARLLAKGAHGPLRSTIQPLTAVAWSSFLTGCRPARHGLFDFIRRPRGTYAVSLNSRLHRGVPDLWEILSDQGKRVAAINVPMMVPVTPVNGILVGGIDAAGLAPETVYPPSFVGQLRTAVPDYRIAASERSPSSWADALHQMVEGRNRILDHLLAHEACDCLMVVYSATDIAQHIFWGHMARQEPPYGGLIQQIYQAADAALGRLLEHRDSETTVLLMSDHGAGPLRGALHMNNYLAAGGFLSYAGSGRANLGSASSGGPLLNHALTLGKRLIPAGGRAWLRRRFGRLRDGVESRLLAASFDWSRTAVFSVGSYGHLYFNIAGREPQGIVPPQAVAALTARVTEHLHALRDPSDGQPLVSAVWPGDVLYDGPGVAAAPDLVVEWADHGYEVRTRYGVGGTADAADVFSATAPLNDLAPETLLTATHRPDGILAAVGPHITPGAFTGAHIVDLAPTILHTLRAPVPAHMDGRVLDALAAGLPPPLTAPSMQRDVEPSDGGSHEPALVLERLRSLGYLQ